MVSRPAKEGRDQVLHTLRPHPSRVTEAKGTGRINKLNLLWGRGTGREMRFLKCTFIKSFEL